MQSRVFITIFFLFLSLGTAESKNSRKPENELSDNKTKFHSMYNVKWKNCFNSGRNWEEDWFLDGKKATIVSDRKGMTFVSGPNHGSSADHAVLWTKKSFSGDIMIDYDFTRLDSLDRYVEILYIQAEGNGDDGYDRDIEKWRSVRDIPAMEKYFEHMNTLHISYAAYGTGEVGTNPHYIRGRRYMPDLKKGLEGTALSPEYLEPTPFLPGIKYHITVIKRGHDVVFRVTDKTGRDDYYWFTSEGFPEISSGRVGLRQMSGRSARFSNIKIYTLKK